MAPNELHAVVNELRHYLYEHMAGHTVVAYEPFGQPVAAFATISEAQSWMSADWETRQLCKLVDVSFCIRALCDKLSIPYPDGIQ